MISCYQHPWCLVSSIKYPYITFFTQICNMCASRDIIQLEQVYCKRNGFKKVCTWLKSQKPMLQFQ